MHRYSHKVYLEIPRMFWDAFMIAAAFPLAVWSNQGIHSGLDWRSLLWLPLLYGMVFLFCMNARGLYESTTFTYQDRTLRGVTASGLCASLASVVFLLFMPQTRGNTDFLAFYSLICVVVLGLRYFLTLSAGHRNNLRSSTHLLLAGTPQAMRNYLFYLGKTSFQVHPIGFLSENPSDTVRDLPRLGGPEELRTILQNRVVDEVILAWSQDRMDQSTALLRECTRMGVLVKVVLEPWSADGAKCHVHSVGPLPVLAYHRISLSGLRQGVKRLMDVTIGAFGCMFMLLSLIPIASILWLQSPGPIFVKVNRVGINGRVFGHLQYRTTELGRDVSSRKDEDLTPIGRFLYQTKLHYLPSFLNVLAGDMSLVGTRSELTSQVCEGSHCVLLKPGLTGLWHVRDFDRVLCQAEVQKLDMEYAEQWTLGLDIRLMLLTPFISLIHRMIGNDTDTSTRIHQQDL